MDRAPIEKYSFHHVYNRGVDKRIVFEDKEDYERFLLYVQVLNDSEIQSPNTFEALSRKAAEASPTERLTNIVAFCLMSNHFHLLLHECREGGISKFMQRLGTAYTMYFNERHERSGALFQGTFKSRLVDDEAYLLKILDYIHLNPRKLGPLRNYTWSSYNDYCGRNMYPKILTQDILEDFTELPRNYDSWIEQQKDFTVIRHVTIDDEKKRGY